jgi:hypothetical protein
LRIGAEILPGGFFLTVVFATLIYALRHICKLALCLIVLGVATVTLRFWADQRHLPKLEFFSQGLSFIAMVVAMVAIFSEVFRARSASSDLVIGAVCLYLIIGLAWTFLLLFNLLAFPRFNFRFTGRLDENRCRYGGEVHGGPLLQLRSTNHDRVER